MWETLILRGRDVGSSERITKASMREAASAQLVRDLMKEILHVSGSPQDFNATSTGFPQSAADATRRAVQCWASGMPYARLLGFVLVLCACPTLARAADPALFYLYLLNGDTLTSYGEFARIDDRVIFSMPVGGSVEDPRLHVVTLPSGMIDWERTERHARSARYQRYVATRGEADFEAVTGEVARVLSQIAATTDPRQALAVAEGARRTLSDWPRAHFGYRQNEVRDVVGILDSAIASLRRTTGSSSFELSLIAGAPPVPVEPLAPMPQPRDQINQIFRVVSMTTQASERVALMQSALALLEQPRGSLPGVDVPAMRRAAEASIRQEQSVDARYARMARRLATSVKRHAAAGRVSRAEQVLADLRRQDARMGRQRPEVVVPLEAVVVANIEAARQLRLLRDRRQLRQSLYTHYQRAVGSQILVLVKAKPQLEAIRGLEGPEPRVLAALRARLAGGAEQLSRVAVPDDMRAAHDLLVNAWRFADTAARGRYEAIVSGNVATAREASSAAAGSLLMFNRAQQEIRTYLEPPRLP
jgi:hypothetical protein